MQQDLTIDSRSLPERIADKIEELVISQTFPMGEKIPNETELSATLNVGRSTVREAIKILVAKNVLEIRRGAGTYVRRDAGMVNDPLGFRFASNQNKLALDLCEIRTIVEPQLAAMAALHATSQDVEQLQSLCDEVADLIRRRVNYGQKDIEFHTKIANCTGNLVVPKLVPIINTGIDTYVGITNFSLAGRASIEHQKIVDAIRRRSPEEAQAAMAEHLKSNRATLIGLEWV